MIQALKDIQLADGATFASQGEIEVPATFGNDAPAIEAARQGVALVDLSHWGLLQISGEDRLNYLHNQSTNTFKALQPGQGCDTVFVTSTARTLDLVTTYVLGDAVLVLVSPNRRQPLMEWLDRYIFPMDRVELADVSPDWAIFRLIGAQSEALLKNICPEIAIADTYGSHQELNFKDIKARVAVGSGLALPGYTLLVSADNAAKLWEILVTAGAVPTGDRVWERLRIEQGRPAPDRELTEDYNPLEAGLWQTISFDKGCYIGQETIARLNTYKGVKQQLWGVRLSTPVEPGSVVTADGEKVGTLTSVTETEAGVFGLAYIRTKAGGAGLNVQVGEAEGEVVDVPFLTHEYQT